MGKSATIDAGQEQHLQALEYANRVRLARARMKRKIAAGELAAGEVILSCPWQAHTMKISDLLMSQKRWGRTRCRRLLMAHSVPENKQVGTLTERQRLALSAVLAAKSEQAERERRGGGAAPPTPPPRGPPRPPGRGAAGAGPRPRDPPCARAHGRLRPGSAGYRPTSHLVELLVGRQTRAARGQLDHVPVGVAQVDRLEVGAVEHLRAGHALGHEVVPPGPELLLGLHPQREVVG